MAFDFKKEYKEFYMPKRTPEIVNVPKANYIAVRGVGDPNEEGGAYKEAIGLLYAIAFTLKMSSRTGHDIEGFFDYVVPPLEGFWWQPGNDQRERGLNQDDTSQQETGRNRNVMRGLDYNRKSNFHWISVIRLPDFIKKEDFDWAVEEAQRKKKVDCSKVEFLNIDEGLCVQMMHIGSYDEEPASIALMDAFVEREGYVNDLTDVELEGAGRAAKLLEEEWYTMNLSNVRFHHEIYLSDARKVEPARRRTVIRHPIKEK